MQPHKRLYSSANNQLLATLSPEELGRLRPHLELVSLPKGKILYDAGDAVEYAYFLVDGMVSLLSITEQAGATVQVAMVGDEGMVGVPIILRINTSPYRIMVQLPGAALRMRANVLNLEFRRDGRMQDSLLRYVHALLTQITQSAVCNRYRPWT